MFTMPALSPRTRCKEPPKAANAARTRPLPQTTQGRKRDTDPTPVPNPRKKKSHPKVALHIP